VKKPIIRLCVVTNKQYEKKDLLRVVRTKEGAVVLDTGGRVYGRGAYMVKSKEALEIARRKNSLGKALEVAIPEEIYEEIARLINE
jgi:predicted RNA-binding protein YlxR (DUF448 family)